MRQFALLAALLFAPAALVPAAFAQSSDHDAVVEAVSYYLDGGTQGDFETLERAFHPTATMRWMDNGEYRDVNAVDFFRENMVNAQPENRATRVVSVNVTGDAATAVLEIEYPTFTFVDHMALLRFADGWKIVGKTFQYRSHASFE